MCNHGGGTQGPRAMNMARGLGGKRASGGLRVPTGRTLWSRTTDLRCSCNSWPALGDVSSRRREAAPATAGTRDGRITTTSPKEARNGYPQF